MASQYGVRPKTKSNQVTLNSDRVDDSWNKSRLNTPLYNKYSSNNGGIPSYNRYGTSSSLSKNSAYSSYDSPSDLITPKYERQLHSEYGQVKQRVTNKTTVTISAPEKNGRDDDESNDRDVYGRKINMEEKAWGKYQQEHARPTVGITPTRIERDYRVEGILVQEVDEGQPCLTCRENCSGFTPHMWRRQG